MEQGRELLSVGIDIGTTTSQVVFSSLSLLDVARPGQIPRINITDRKILYQSQIVFTPLVDDETIDVVRLKEFLQKEYAAAGIMPSQVETGAAIITGETAKKKNADEILRAVAGLAGDFVVTVAGPHVESLIAGRGSGAATYSREHFNTLTNIDIGGGSANSALFRQGNLAAAAAMNFGGRVIEIERASGRVRRLSRPGQILCQAAGVQIKPGDVPSMLDLARVCDVMAGLTVELIEGGNSALAQKLYLTPPTPISGQGKPVMISGGVGRYFYEPIAPRSVAELAVHEDIGPLLAERLRAWPGLQAYTLLRPPETMRATVLGASSQFITLSGSTIWAERGILPLRNVPVVRPVLEGELAADQLASAVEAATGRWDIDLNTDAFAIALDIERVLDYSALVRLAEGLKAFAGRMPADRPLIAIIQRDYAQSLGQTLKALVGSRPLLIIDQVGLEEGDFIDIGMPLMDGRVVPLSVKTLVFYSA
jgi:ethanolamine utilization protein EutA